MTTKNKNLIFYFSFGLFTMLMLFSASMYFFKHEMIRQAFTSLGYPAYLVYPLASAKILGLVAIWTNKSKLLKAWAYAGFFFDVVLAFTAHLAVSDGGHAMALAGIILIVIARWYDKRI